MDEILVNISRPLDPTAAITKPLTDVIKGRSAVEELFALEKNNGTHNYASDQPWTDGLDRRTGRRRRDLTMRPVPRAADIAENNDRRR